MAPKNKRKTSNQTNPQLSDARNLQKQHHPNNDYCFEGDHLFRLLHSFQRVIESELESNKTLPEKLWFKQHFAVGINEVTRILERMNPLSDGRFAADRGGSPLSLVSQGRGCPPCSSVNKLQAVLVASDCNSKWLTKHLPSLATSRNVPLIYVKDNKEGSLRLGGIVKVKTVIALGVKVKQSSINQRVEEFLSRDELTGAKCIDSTELAKVFCH
ncbi:hypothetical protein BVRB_6g128640 [Beta vulgaris subsp. vulgaris]|uniref:uncharacterized protein LOC104894994 n=1 Tax=Beta vulgaris subsp. vulgaris TaxID=3555 RepID=UPI00053FCCAC|nr:uncharacterized protein LOC104894994 [Beta vulgaris subsp. vulgaris]KMT09890.1 hypothetical protein BVRB_6g128640 [Beta vulgaris subsp. vulgaris]